MKPLNLRLRFKLLESTYNVLIFKKFFFASAASPVRETASEDNGNLDSTWADSPGSVLQNRKHPMNRKVSFQFEGTNVSPIPVSISEPEKKRGRSSILKRELKVVVPDIRKTLDSTGSGSPDDETKESMTNGDHGIDFSLLEKKTLC